MRAPFVAKSPRLLVSLAAAVIQGFLLFWLHTAMQGETWPATHLGWFAAIHSVVLFVPLTIHLLGEHWRMPALWWLTGTMGAAFFYFGWHFGTSVGVPLTGRLVEPEAAFVYAVSLALLWLLFMPFLRCRLDTGRWRCGYAQLFTVAWQNKIMLAEAALFTGVLWLLLGLWAVLFRMLGYELFQNIFTWPAFVYPFTTTAFGVALYLTGSVERIVTVVREQLLGLLKWLAPVAALILALFAPTLLVELPNLVFSGERAIGAAWLLWLLAVTVLLLNAAYQNGSIERPYPPFLAFALRIVVPAMVIVALTATYALYVRISEYGLTVERVFAIIVALAALAYSIGYTVAAIRRGPWLRGIERVNVGVAVALIVVIGLTLTPVASPFRLAASSQYSRAMAGDVTNLDSALHYLRFETGAYGRRALERLSKLQGDEKNLALAREARRYLEMTSPHPPMMAHGDVLSNIVVYPAGREIDPALADLIRRHVVPPVTRVPASRGDDDSQKAASHATALFVDLNADSVEECVVLTEYNFTLFSRRGEQWVRDGWGQPSRPPLRVADLQEALQAGDFAVQPARWHDLRIGRQVLRMNHSAGPAD